MAPGRAASGDAGLEFKTAKLVAGGVHSQPSLGDGLDRQGGTSVLEDAVWRSNLRGDATLVGKRAAAWYTGLQPGACPGAQPDETVTSLPLPVRGGGG